MPAIDPKELQFIADRSGSNGYSYKGQMLKLVAVQRAPRFRLRHKDGIAHEIFYSPYHDGIVYNYWPGARFFFVIARFYDMDKYLRYFIREKDTVKSRLWRWLHNYELI